MSEISQIKKRISSFKSVKTHDKFGIDFIVEGGLQKIVQENIFYVKGVNIT